MPREYSTLDIDAESSIRGGELPELTYGSAVNVITDCDFVVISLFTHRPRRPYNSDAVANATDKGLGNRAIHYNRNHRLQANFLNRFSHLISDKDAENRQTSSYGPIYYKLTPEDSYDFYEIEKYFNKMVPLWETAVISMCWSDHQHPKASSIIYQVDDELPPHPKTTEFKQHTEYANLESDTEKRKAHKQQRLEYLAHERKDDVPRFKFGPAYIINGDYGAGGCDIHYYAQQKFNHKMLFDLYDHQNTLAFPSINDIADSPNEYIDNCESYPQYLDITNITHRKQRIQEKDTPEQTITQPPEINFKPMKKRSK
jgi:hypothetical protein